MTYFEPYIDETGLHLPNFQDIKNYYTEGAKGIFGNDIYIDEDSMDGQLISIFAKGCYDSLKSIEFAYNNYSPQKAFGNVLASLVKLSGISKHIGKFSTVYLELSGLPNALIRNGKVKDQAGNIWALPKEVVLGDGGYLYTTATCEKEGAITALPNTVNIIDTPTYGWNAVTNLIAANPAQPIENDINLYNRYRKSVALPSKGLVEGVQSAILEVKNVIAAIVKENPTGEPITVDGVELPPHSITTVVEGGSEIEIANAIFLHKAPGCYTNGDTTITTFDRYHNVNYINFFRPTRVPIFVDITIKPKYNYNSSYVEDITNRLVGYVNEIGISNDVVRSVLEHEAYDCNSDLRTPAFSIESISIGTSIDNLDKDDITILLNEIAVLEASNLKMTVKAV